MAFEDVEFDPAVFQQELALAADSLAKASKHKHGLEKKKGDQDNWVEKTGPGGKGGELPAYIQHVALGIRRSSKGKLDTSQSIRIAIGKIEDWKDGKGGVDANTKAAAAKAWAEWEAMKAKSHAKDLSAADFDPERFSLELALAREEDGLELATFDEAKHPRLKGKFVAVNNVLRGKGGGNYKVDKIDKDNIHVRQTYTLPGQSHHDPSDKLHSAALKIPHADIGKVFDGHAEIKKTENEGSQAKAKKAIAAEKSGSIDWTPDEKQGILDTFDSNLDEDSGFASDDPEWDRQLKVIKHKVTEGKPLDKNDAGILLDILADEAEYHAETLQDSNFSTEHHDATLKTYTALRSAFDKVKEQHGL